MKLKLNKYQWVVLIISIIVGIAGTIFINCISPVVKEAFTNPEISQKEYDVLKEYAIEISKTLDTEIIEDEKLYDKNVELKDDAVEIKLDSYRCGIEATFPLKQKEIKVDNGVVQYEATIDYDNVSYIEHKNFESAIYYILMDISMAGCIALFVCFLLALPVYIYIKAKQQKEQKQKN